MKNLLGICFMNLISFYCFSQIEINKQDSGKCFSMCGAPMIYRIENITAVNIPKHKKTLSIPSSYLVSSDTVQFASGDSVWKTLPGIYDAVEEKISLSNGKTKTITKYKVIQEPKHEFTRDEKKIKEITIYEAADLPGRKKIEFPATYTKVSLRKLVNPEVKEIEIQVLCSDKLTEKIIDQIQMKLKGLGYETNNFSNELGETTLDSLKKFQQANELPIGGLNFPTLDLLGIAY